MKYLLCLAAVSACAYAQVSLTPEQAEQHPQFDYAKDIGRHPRDIRDTSTIWNKEIGKHGRFFGDLGHDGSGLSGKAGYNHQIFNDARGTLNAQAYGSHVLGPYGDSTSFGGKVNWENQNAKAAVELSKSIGGHTALQATAQRQWKLDKNTQVSVGGVYKQPFVGHGRSDYGVKVVFDKEI